LTFCRFYAVWPDEINNGYRGSPMPEVAQQQSAGVRIMLLFPPLQAQL